MARLNELRVLTKVARMYYEQDLRQPEIAERLHLSQATISRLLKRAEREGIVRITVSVPVGAYPELEDGLQERYGLREAVVVDSPSADEAQIMRDLGGAAAHYVESTIRPGDVLGVASYASLLPMVDAMHPLPTVKSGAGGDERITVVQLSGGVGNPAAEAHATQLTRRLADLVRGEAVFLPAPGLAPSPQTREMFLQDPFVRAAMEAFDRVTLALVGVGSTEVRSPTGFMSAFTPAERELLAALGAVGFICHCFFEARGGLVTSALDERITAMSRTQLERVPRVVGISGGPRRLPAIRGALAGGWISVLITDHVTARRLLEGRPK
jgi:DNA-binding transcriptional regulator LsrR (DeoR family)